MKVVGIFAAMMMTVEATKGSEQEQPVAKVDLEADAEAHCGDGSRYCTDDKPICCFNGSYLNGCCDVAHPVCDTAHNKCLSRFEAAMLEIAGPSNQEKPAAKLQTEADAEAHCGDGTRYCTDDKPICCFNGSYLNGCCDIAHPVCDNAHDKCLSKFEAAMLEGSGPSKEEKPVKVERESEVEGHCGDGTRYCTDDKPICCFNGSYLNGCCDVAHPVCDNAHDKCLSKFEAAMLASAGPSEQEKPVAKVELEADAEAHCGDGTRYCTDDKPICCFNGSYLNGCCDIAHPVCDNAHDKCLSKFEAAMLGSSGPSEQEKPVVKVDLEADAESHCGDGTRYCTDDKPICCFNGSYLSGCCDVAHPVCDTAHNLCHSKFEAAMLAGPTEQEKPGSEHVMV